MSDDRAIDVHAERASLESLEPPRMDVGSLVKHFGPGMILMMTGVGTSHLVTAPTAGGRYEYALLWCIPVAYIFKYYGFEMAFRFTQATGQSLMDAYATAWKRWPLWYVMLTTLLQCAIGQAGRLVAASAVLYYLFSAGFGIEIPMAAIGFVLGVVCVITILRGSYATVEHLTKAFAGMLLVSALAVYAAGPAPLSSFSHFVTLETPPGSWLIIAAFLGLLPTGIDVSLQASEWGKAKNVGLGRIRPQAEALGLARPFDPFTSSKEDLSVRVSGLPTAANEYCRRWFQIALWDFRFGHIVSFVIACVFMLTAAVWLYPSDVQGQAVMGEIAQIFTRSIGPWMMVVFLLGAFAATFSTAFNYFDGWPRIVAACCRNMFHKTAALHGIARSDLRDEHRRHWYSEYNIYRATMIFSLVASVAIIAGIPRPVFLVLVASAAAFFVAPVIFYLNLYYCLTVIPRDEPFYPSPFAKWFGWLSLAVFSGMTAMLVLVRVFGVQLG